MADLGADDLRFLTMVRLSPGTSPARLAKSLGTTTAVVARRAAALEADGLLELRAHPDRPSVKELHVTEAAKAYTG